MIHSDLLMWVVCEPHADDGQSELVLLALHTLCSSALALAFLKLLCAVMDIVSLTNADFKRSCC